VADYFFEKDRIFAGINLSVEELVLYLRLEEGMGERLPRPDAIIFLRASLPVLLERVRRRGIAYELGEDLPGYLEKISTAYSEHFRRPERDSVLVVDTDDMDLVRGRGELEAIVSALGALQPGLNDFDWPPRGGQGRGR
jgi:deoxyadenosine/deoxycytidine kinase